MDNASETIVVGEVTDGGPWFAAGSGTARPIDAWLKRSTWSYHPGGGNFAFVDGRVQFVSVNIDAQTLRHMATARGKDPVAGSESDDKTTRPAAPSSGDEAERTKSRDGLDEQGGGSKSPLVEPSKEMAAQMRPQKNPARW